MPDILPTINNEPPQGIQALLDTVYLWNPDVANDLIEKINELLGKIDNVSGKIPPYSELEAPILQYMPCYDGDNVYVAAQDLEELPGTLDPSQWILIATKAPVLQAGTGISIDGNEISVTQAISDGAAAGSTAVQPNDLGTAAYAATTDFATAAQGSLADSAVQPGDLGTAAYAASSDFATAVQGAKADTAVQPGDLGTAAYASTSDFATAVQGGKADTAVQPGDLGTAAYAATTDFATASQGAKADTAVQPGDLATVATTGSYNDLMHKPTIPAAQVNSDWTATSGVAEILHKPTLGTAAAEDTTAFATAAQGTKADTAVQPGDLGTAAYAATTDFATSTQGGKADTALQPADIVDNLTSTATNKALSANQGKELEAQIVALEGRGHYLSSWNCATGLAGTNPPTSPYTYTAGDYFIVGTVDTTTNYRPSGSQYVTGTASTTVETEQVAVNDTYTYDGTNWSLLKTSKVDALPPQAGNAGKFLTTDGTDASWATVDALPNQTGNSGKFLTTNGSAASWSDKPLVNASTLSNSMVIAGTDSSSGGANTILGVFGTASGTAYRGAAFGLSSKIGKAGTVTFNTVAFGADADAQASYGMAIGGDAVVTGEHAIQLGSTGNTTTNSDANTVKIANANGNFEIMSANGTIPEARLADTTSATQGQALVLDSNLNAIWSTVESLPSQSGQSGKYLTTNGTTASWAAVEALPSQSGNSGKLLTTNGTAASWDTKANLGLSGVTLRTWGANE